MLPHSLCCGFWEQIGILFFCGRHTDFLLLFSKQFYALQFVWICISTVKWLSFANLFLFFECSCILVTVIFIIPKY